MSVNLRPARLARLVVLVAALAFIVAAAPVPGADATATPEASAAGVAVPSARLRATITTTSDWTQVQVRPGEMVAHRVVRAPSDVRVATRPDGWRVVNPTGGRVVVEVEAVLAEVTGAPTFAVHVDKGFVGRTVVELLNTTGDTPTTVAQVHNDVRSLEDFRNRESVWRARDEVLGTQRLALPHADARRLVLAFYYPWFTDYRQPTLTDRPADPRSTQTGAGVLSMTQQARSHGVDGFIVSWAGEEADGRGFDLAHAAARRTDGLVTGYLETQAARGVDGRLRLVVLADWLEQLARRADGSFLSDGDGVPVVFVWQMGTVPPWGWQLVLDELEDRGTPVRLVGDTSDPDYADVAWGVHRYSALGTPQHRAAQSQYRDAAFRGDALLEGSAPRLHVGGVAPGYDDHLVRDGNPVIERGDEGQRYDALWDAALSGDPDWVTVTSWNEWYEGTSIEPGVTAGDLALRQTRDRAAAWRD